MHLQSSASDEAGTMKYLSVCSGIEAATVAWRPLGWQAVAFAENDKFPSALLAHHYPDTPNLGDINDFKRWPDADVDVLVGGTPCQSFSVAGLRKGMADPRGNLTLVYLAILARYRPRRLVWENVPGVLSSNEGRDFGAIIGAMVELGYSCTWRVLDAQYFGVPQRRRRVFVVGHLGDWRRAAEVLFEPESLRRNPAPGRETRKKITDNTISRALTSSQSRTGRLDPNETTYIAAVAQNQRDEVRLMDKVGALAADPGAKQQTYIAHGIPGNWIGRKPENGGNATEFPEERAPSLTSTDRHGVVTNMAVRRLTPLECERLQGFPDGYTDIPGASDSGRYKALGNSMAVPVMRWIGRRIDAAPCFK